MNDDPWATAVFVVSDTSSATAVGSLQVEYGEDYDNTVGRTFVLHESSGGRVSCNRMGVCGDAVCDAHESSTTCESDCPTTTETVSTTALETTKEATTEAPETYEDTCSVYQTRTVAEEDCDSNFWLVGSVSDRLAGKPTNSDWDLCMITNDDGTLEWGVKDSGAVYRTCVQASADPAEACNGNLVCGTDVVGNSNGQSWTISYVTRDNYMHQDCPSIQSQCAVQSNWWYGVLEGASTLSSDFIRGNVCLGEDKMVRVVTKDGLVDTCVGYQYEQGRVAELTCPTDRDYICGTLVQDGMTVFGWPTAQAALIATALESENHVHPQCGPFLTCC